MSKYARAGISWHVSGRAIPAIKMKIEDNESIARQILK